MSIIKVVNNSGKKYSIDTSLEINRGGEGRIFDIQNDAVAKIYHPGIETLSQAKFDFLTKLDRSLFVAPQELLYDSNSKVVGFTMEFLDSDFFPLSSLFIKSFCLSNNIDKKIKLRVIENITKAIEYAHMHKIVIGDLNCFNIMVNNKGDIKFIDTDSYQVPGFQHSGRLLDDIRDYFYQGRIDTNSDYYALSVLSFNLLSFAHPFKGIHKLYMKLVDRIVHKIPIFANDPDLKVPKCYEPINDMNLMGQFKRLYINGERFLISMSNVNANTIVITMNQPALIKKYEQDELIITDVSNDMVVNNIFSSESFLVIETEDNFLLYSTRNKGYVTLQDTISKKEYSRVFVGNKNILLKKDRELFVYCGVGNIVKSNSFIFPEKYINKQFENVLVVIDYDRMTKIFIDECYGSIVKVVNTNVYGKGFQSYNSLIYSAGGKQNIFYNESGNEVSIVNLSFKIQDLYQDKNMGIIQYIENKEIKYKFFKIKNLKISVSQNTIDNWSNFAFRGDKDGEGFLFVPVDDAIKIFRSNDFAEISEMKCGLVSTNSIIKNTDSGLILFENSKVWLLNKK